MSQESECSTTEPFGTPGEELYNGLITSASSTDIPLAVSGPAATDVLCLTTTAETITPDRSGSYVFTFRADQQ